MELIIGQPRSGKTTKLIALAAQNFSYIVCRSLNDAYRIKKQAAAMGLDIPLPISYSAVRESYGKSMWSSVVERGVYVDDAGAFIQSFMRERLRGMTVEQGPPAAVSDGAGSLF